MIASPYVLAPARLIIPLTLAALAGICAAFSPQAAFLFLAMGAVGLATRFVEKLAILTFWTLPYMVVNLPTGSFTLKLPEVLAYLFAAAAFLRAYWRRERLAAPPATFGVIVYIAVLCISTAASPVVPESFRGTIGAMDRNSPALRSISIVAWLVISWSVVGAAYHVIGQDPALFRRCLRAHVLGGGLAATLSLVIYGLALSGLSLQNVGGLGVARNLAPFTGDVFRLAGVAYEPLFLAFYLVTVIPITLVAIMTQLAGIPKTIAGLCLAVELLAMMLTFSTGGYVAAGVALISLVPTLRGIGLTRRKTIGMLAVAAVIFAVLGSVYLVRVGGIGYLGVVFGKLLTGGDDIRQAEMAAGYRIVEDYALLGVGPGMAGFHFPRYHPVMQSQLMAGGIPEINNVYIAAFAESGVFGLASLLMCGLAGAAALTKSLLNHGFRRGMVLGALFASLVGCAVQYLSLNPLVLIYFTGLVALSVSAHRLLESGEFDLNGTIRHNARDC